MKKNDEKLAIIGMGCLFPGSTTPEAFYRSLLNHNEYLDQEIVYDIDIKKLDCDVDEDELNRLDDVFRYTLFTVHEALKDSGYLKHKEALKNTGLIMGTRETPDAKTYELFKPLYLNELERNSRELLNRQEFKFAEPDDSRNASPLNAHSFAYPSLYSAHALSMKGPVFAIDAACAASLYTTKIAMHYLASGQTYMMVAGGVFCGQRNKGFPYFLRKLGVTPDQSKSIPLDKNSGGMVTHEGGGAFVLKRLSDAVRDKDRIHAVIDRIGWSNDGTGKFFLAPSKKGQIIAYKNTFGNDENSEVDTIDYIECHATGTQVGDSVELDSLEKFYGHRRHVPIIGAVKGNIGHLLTGAGAAGMIKVIMSMKNGVIPATINVNDPLSSKEGSFSGKNMVLENTPWPESGSVKKAAVSAFGFGGINSHLVIRQYQPEAAQARPFCEIPDAPPPKTAITGISLHLGNIEGVKAYNDALYYGKHPKLESNPRRLRGMEQNSDFLNHLNLQEGIPPGFYQSPFLFDYLKNKVHPKDDHEAVDKEMLFLKLADEALTDAGIEPGEPQNIATIVCAKQNLAMMPFYSNAYLPDYVRAAQTASNIDLEASQSKALAKIARRAIDPKENDFDRITTGIGPIIATRIPSLWNFIGPAFKMSCMDNSFLRGLEFGKLLLETGDVEAVLIGVIDNDPILENLIWHHCYGKAYGMDPRDVTFSEGGAAIVLKRAADINSGEKLYARIDDIKILREDPPFSACPSFPETVAGFHSPPDSGQDDEHPEYLEFYGRTARHEAAPESLTRLDDNLGQACSKSLPVGYSLDQFGCSQMSGQALSVIKAALMLHYSYKPPTPKKIYDEQKKTWNHRTLSLDSSPFYWQQSNRPKSVSVTGPTKDGSSGRIILSEGGMAGSGEPHGAMAAVNQPMLILSGKDKESLQNELQMLQKSLESNPSLPYLAQKYKAQFEKRQGQDKDFVMVIQGGTTEKMLADVKKAIPSIGDAFSRRGQWQGDNGSFFTASPLGANGKIAFVYPPSGLNSQNALYELTSTFPQLIPFYNGFLQANAHQENKYITRFNDYLKSKEQLPLYMDAILASMTTELIVNVLGINPRMVLGCSFGEVIMYSATKMLTEESTANLINDVVSPLIANLSHPEHIRRYFRDDQPEWVTYYCKGRNGNTQTIEKELKNTKKAFLTIKAAPGHVIISGLQRECDRIIKKTRCFAYQLSRNIFVHTPLAMAFYDDIYKETLAHSFTFSAQRRSTFYTTRDCQPFSFTKEQFARNMADCICKSIDFEAVIKKSYDDGARIFIGMDSSDLCAEWISRTLEGREAMVLPVKKSDITLNQSIQCLIAKLISNGIPVNLDHLINYPTHQATNKGLVKPITHNPRSIREIMLDPENIALFRPVQSDVSTDITEELPDEASETSSEPAADKQQPPVNEAATHTASQSQVGTYDWKPAMTAEELQKRHNQNVQMHERFMAVQDQLNGFLHDLILKRYGSASVAEGEPKPFNAEGEPASDLNRGVLWDERQIFEMTTGHLSSILGSRYEMVDQYPVRARLPLPPFMFVSRVTAIDAEFGILRPSRIEIEYDVPVDAWYLSDGKAPFTIISESSHCGILLLSYIGVDSLFAGKRRFRALSSNTRILSEKLIRAGETVKGIFNITSFTSLNDHTLVFYTYDLFDQSDACIFRMTGSGGFFTEQELKNAKGYLEPAGRTAEKKPESAAYQPTLTCERTAFDERDIVNLQNGRDDLCFSPSYGQYDDPEQIYPNNFKVLSRVPALDKHGGDYGMGWVKGEADIDPNNWIFDAHFKNDPVLPATVVIEGGIQLLSFYAHYIGLKKLAGPGSYRNTLLGTESKAVFRGEVGREDGKVTYECHVKKITPGPETSLSADFKAYCKDRVVVIVQGLSIKMIPREEQHHATFLVA